MIQRSKGPGRSCVHSEQVVEVDVPSHVVGIVMWRAGPSGALELMRPAQQLEPGKLVLPALHTTTEHGTRVRRPRFVGAGSVGSIPRRGQWTACVSMGAPPMVGFTCSGVLGPV